ncbi:lipoxygenase homology domain-containing protein 1 [Elysia marginata]|uniref:Lipoxygenase homology domain-containing protein 1 n=1 Tax=Elysia marginata TaxID=1093978 RepID=A0AAV4ELJ8_9GAST|nr:lipoxygenase homology domain-containing protein 1 [Elysia marginata]
MASASVVRKSAVHVLSNSSPCWVGNEEKRDEQVEITLPVISSRPSTVAVPTSEFPDFPVTRGQWSVETLTGTDGTMGDISDAVVIFCGSKGESSPVSLTDKRENPFQAGMMDKFELSLSEDVGDVIKMRIGFEDNLQPKSWHLKRIHFEDVDTKDTFWSSFTRPIAVNETSDGWTEFPVVWPGVFILPVVRYHVTVSTADSPGAGTDQAIMVKLDGQMGSTGYRRLQDSTQGKQHFQQGQTDSFMIEAVSLLTLDSITIGHFSGNPGDGWFLLRVTVKPENEEDAYVFVCNRWLDAGQDDGETVRTLYPGGGDDGSSALPTARSPHKEEEREEINNTPIEAITVAPVAGKRRSSPSPDPFREQEKMSERHEEKSSEIKPETPPKSETPKPKVGAWRVYTVTAPEADSGTEANVSLTVFGTNGQLGPLSLESEEQDCFQPGKTDQFDIFLDQDLIGPLKKIRLEHDNAGQSAGWRVSRLILENQVSQDKHEFNVDRWLSFDAENGDIVYEAGVDSQDGPALESCQYLVKTVTEALENAGTEANVHITLVGSQGDSGKRTLKNSSGSNKKFLEGKTDSFILEAVDLGDLQKVIVGHDGGSEPDAAWGLQCVMVRKVDPHIRESSVFPYGKSITGGVENQVTITVSEKTKMDVEDADAPKADHLLEKVSNEETNHNEEEKVLDQPPSEDTEEIKAEEEQEESGTIDQDMEEETGGGQEEAPKEENADVDMEEEPAQKPDAEQNEAPNEDAPEPEEGELRLQLPETARTDQVGTQRTEDEGYDESVVIPTGDDSTYRTEGTDGDHAGASHAEDTEREQPSAGMYTASDDGETARDVPQSEQPTERESDPIDRENPEEEPARPAEAENVDTAESNENVSEETPKSDNNSKAYENDNTNMEEEDDKVESNVDGKNTDSNEKPVEADAN